MMHGSTNIKKKPKFKAAMTENIYVQKCNIYIYIYIYIVAKSKSLLLSEIKPQGPGQYTD